MSTEQILWDAKFETETIETIETNNELDKVLQELYKMTEKEACLLYNVDSKAEAELIIKDYWN